MCRRDSTTKTIYRRLLALPLAVVMLLVGASPVLAADPAIPDVFTIDDVQVVTGVAADSDVLVAFKYTISYSAGQPSTPANRLFHFRLMDTDGSTQLGAVEPYAYNNSGYDMGYSAFYFDITSAPDWEAAVQLRMLGNPQYWDSPPEVNYTLEAADYSQLESQSENQDLLGNWIISVSQELEVDWSVKLLTETQSGSILNNTGAAYGTGTIQGLQTFAPDIFAVQNMEIDEDRRGWTTAIADTWTEQWDGTIIGDSLDGLMSLFGTSSWLIITSLITLVLCVGVWIWGFMWISDNSPAMIANSHILSGSTALGFLHPGILATIVLLYALATGYMIWGDKS